MNVYHIDSHKEEKQILESIIIPGNFLTTSPSWHSFLVKGLKISIHFVAATFAQVSVDVSL